MRTTILNLMVPLALVLSLASCNNDDDNIKEGESRITIKSTAQITQTTSENSRVVVGAFSIRNFQVGIQNFDMSYAASSDIKAGVNIGNLQLKSNATTEVGTSASQPKTSILINEGVYQTAVIGEGSTPNGNYTEITFKLHQNQTAGTDSFVKGKSLYIIGEVSGKPARIFMTGEEPIRATASATNGYEINGNTDLLVRFNLNNLFANMNLATATDGNGDGIIDIGPNNVDNNSALFTKIRANLNSSVEFVK